MCWQNIPRITCVCLFVFFLSPLCFGKTGTRGRSGRIRGDDASPPVSLSLSSPSFFSNDRSSVCWGVLIFALRRSVDRSFYRRRRRRIDSKPVARFMEGTRFFGFCLQMPEPTTLEWIDSKFVFAIVVLSFILSLSLSSTRKINLTRRR